MTNPVLSTPEPDRWTLIKQLWMHDFTALWVVPGVLFGLFAGFVVGWMAHSASTAQEIGNFVESFLPEALSIGLSITALYYFDGWRENRREDKRLQEELLWQVRSRANDVAISAIDRLRFKDWLHLLKEWDLRDIQWTGAALQEIDLSGADMHYANLSSADMDHANLSSADMDHANLSSASMMNANLSGVFMRDTNLDGAKIIDTNLSNANMMSANLSGADMSFANLSSAKMRSANLENADLENVIFDENTGLPDGTYWTSETDMSRFTDPNHPQFWRSNSPLSPAYRGKDAESE